MSIVWKPNGSLDVATAATDLPETASQYSTISEAFARCKNLRLDRRGQVSTRYGSSRVSSRALAGAASMILEQSGSRYEFFGDAIYLNESSIGTVSGSGQWSGVKYNAFNDTTEQIFAANGTSAVRISGASVNTWGIAAPTTAPTATTGALTGLTGNYSVKYTYARKVGSVVVTESNPSDASNVVTLSNGSLAVTVTASTDSQVTHIRLYRTLAGGSIYYYDQDVAVGTTTFDTNTADGSLSVEVATDHNPPPTGATVVVGPLYNGYLFAAVGNLLYWCKAQQPEYWPADQYIEVGPPQYDIKAATDYAGQLHVATESRLYFIQGTGGDLFLPIQLQSITGARGLYGLLGVEGHGVFHTGRDGIYVYSGGKDSKLTLAALEPLFRGVSSGGVPAVTGIDNSWLWQYEDRIYFHYGTGAVIVFGLGSGRISYYQYDLALSAPAIDESTGSMLACDTAGYVRNIEDRSATTDAGTAISWEAQSKDFTLQTRAHFPRWAKYDVDGAATAAIVLDDVIHQTHALTTSRDTRHRLIKTGNGQRCALRLSGSGAVTIYAAEME
jgi:hypothetical protein